MCSVVAVMGVASRITHMALCMAMPTRMRCTHAKRRAILLGDGIAKQYWSAEKQSQEDRYETETFAH
jgi:hypothetical protein